MSGTPTLTLASAEDLAHRPPLHDLACAFRLGWPFVWGAMIVHSGGGGGMTSGFEVTSIVLTLCETQTVQSVILLPPRIPVPLRMLPQGHRAHTAIGGGRGGGGAITLHPHRGP